MILLSLFLLLLSPSLASQYTPWQYNVTKNGLEFEKIRFSVSQDDTLAIITYLKKNTEIGGVPIVADWVHFYPDWSLKLFKLSKDYDYQTRHLPKNTWVRASLDSSYFCVFENSWEKVSSHPIGSSPFYICKGGGDSKGTQTSFYPTDELHSFYSPDNITIDNIKCRGGLLSPIFLHKNGSLKKCTLASSQIINEIEYKKNSKIELDTSGNVRIIK